MRNLSAQDRRNLGLTIAGEIHPGLSPYGTAKNRNEIAGILGVVSNRFSINKPGVFGKTAQAARNAYRTITDVVKQPSQFSTWNTVRDRNIAKANYAKYSTQINAAIDDFLNGTLASPVPDATHYWSPQGMMNIAGVRAPSWANRIDDQTEIGAHVFGTAKSLVDDLEMARKGVPTPTPAPRDDVDPHAYAGMTMALAPEQLVADPIGTVTRAALQGVITPEQAAEIAAAYSDPSRAQEAKAAVQAEIAAAYADPSRMADVMAAAPTQAVRPELPATGLPAAPTQAVRPAPTPTGLPAAPVASPPREAVFAGINGLTDKVTDFHEPTMANAAINAALSQAPATPTTVASRPATPAPTGLPAARPSQPSRPATPTPAEALAAMTRDAQAAEAAAKASFDASPPDAARFDAGFGKPSVASQVDAGMRSVSPPAGTQLADSPTAGAQPGIDKALRDATVASMAEQYGSYRTPTNYQQVRDKMQAKPAPVTAKPAAPVAPQVAGIAPGIGEYTAAMNEMAEPSIDEVEKTAKTEIAEATELAANLDTAESGISAAEGSARAPAARAADVYSGVATEAMDNTGQNKVSRNIDGTTSVTNKYGVTTTTMPDGKQAATSAPNVGDINAALGSMSKPSLSQGSFKSKAKDIGSTVAGAVLGGYLGGPIGAALGAKVANTAVMGVKPDSLLGRALGLNQFPGAPNSPGATRNASGWDSAADRSRGQSMSPKAAADIDAGRGGLF